MSIFKHWEQSVSIESKNDSTIRATARHLVESGQISLRQATEAAEAVHNLDLQDKKTLERSVGKVRDLFDKAGVGREGFKYDKFNLSEADYIFADALKDLVLQFHAQKTLSTMSKEQLTARADELAADRNKFVDELNRRFPSPPAADANPTPAKFERQKKTDAEIDAECEAQWAEHLKQPTNDLGRYNSLHDFQQHMRYRNQNGS